MMCWMPLRHILLKDTCTNIKVTIKKIYLHPQNPNSHIHAWITKHQNCCVASHISVIDMNHAWITKHQNCLCGFPHFCDRYEPCMDNKTPKLLCGFPHFCDRYEPCMDNKTPKLLCGFPHFCDRYESDSRGVKVLKNYWQLYMDTVSNRSGFEVCLNYMPYNFTTNQHPHESDSYISQLWALGSHTAILVFCYPCIGGL